MAKRSKVRKSKDTKIYNKTARKTKAINLSSGAMRGGINASLKALVDHMAETAIDPAGQTVFISHGDCEGDANRVAEDVKRRFGVQTVVLNNVGPVIGAHSGPGTVALFFLGRHR